MTTISPLPFAIAQAEFDKHQPDVVVGSSRGGAVAMNINSGDAKLVLLCPAWKKWGTAKTVKPGTVILHSRSRRRDSVCRLRRTGQEQRVASVGTDRGRHGSPTGGSGVVGEDAGGVRRSRDDCMKKPIAKAMREVIQRLCGT